MFLTVGKRLNKQHLHVHSVCAYTVLYCVHITNTHEVYNPNDFRSNVLQGTVLVCQAYITRTTQKLVGPFMVLSTTTFISQDGDDRFNAPAIITS